MKISLPRRASHTYTQRLVASVEQVFRLLCPVREADWLDGWDPVSVSSYSGVAERDCAFVTTAGDAEAVWYITRHEPDSGFVEMIKITPQVTACRLTIKVTATPEGAQAEITYMHISLAPEGDRLVDSFTADAYVQFMQDWEARMNHYLRHGSGFAGPRRISAHRDQVLEGRP